VDRYTGPDGVVFHAEVMLGDSVLMLGEPMPGQAAMPASLSYYVDDATAVEAAYRRALEAGARSVTAPATQPWGYRSACVTDAGGNRWTICAIVEQVSHDEIVRRMQDMPKS
jgi:PhnB protein